jgi:hypothetical protein
MTEQRRGVPLWKLLMKQARKEGGGSGYVTGWRMYEVQNANPRFETLAYELPGASG